MHIDHAPRSEYCLFVGVAEISENVTDELDALFDRHVICSTRQRANTLTSGGKDVRVVVLDELGKDLLGNALRHKLGPRHIIHELAKVLNGQLFVFVADSSAVDHERHANRNTAQN